MTARQLEFIKDIHRLKDEVWAAKNTHEIINIAQKVIEDSKSVEAAKIKSSTDTEIIDTKSKTLAEEALKNDIEMLKNKVYENLDSEKFAVVSSFQILIGAISHLSVEELLEILKS